MSHRPAIDGIRGVLFDMDGVLCNSGPFLFEASARMFQATYGVTIRKDDVLPFFGRGEDAYLRGTGAKYGIRINLERDKASVYRYYFESIRGALHPFPGIADFIADARSRGLQTAVASSAERAKVNANLQEIGLMNGFFDAVVSVEDVVRPKPAPDIFLRAARDLGLGPDECVVIEDAPSGIRAAKAAGCLCVGFTSGFAPADLEEAGADVTTSTLSWTTLETGIRKLAHRA